MRGKIWKKGFVKDGVVQFGKDKGKNLFDAVKQQKISPQETLEGDFDLYRPYFYLQKDRSLLPEKENDLTDISWVRRLTASNPQYTEENIPE